MAAGAALGSSAFGANGQQAVGAPPMMHPSDTLLNNLQNAAPWDSLAMLVIPQQSNAHGVVGKNAVQRAAVNELPQVAGP